MSNSGKLDFTTLKPIDPENDDYSADFLNISIKCFESALENQVDTIDPKLKALMEKTNKTRGNKGEKPTSSRVTRSMTRVSASGKNNQLEEGMEVSSARKRMKGTAVAGDTEMVPVEGLQDLEDGEIGNNEQTMLDAFVPHPLIPEILAYHKAEEHMDLFAHKTGEWYDRVRWASLPPYETVFKQDLLAVNHLKKTRFMESLPLDNVLCLRTIRRKRVDTDKSDVEIDAYSFVVMKCFEHYFGQWPQPAFNYEVVKYLHAFERLRVLGTIELNQKYGEVYDELDRYGMHHFLDYLSGLLLYGGSFQSIEVIDEAFSPKDAKESLENIRGQAPFLAKFFDMISWFLMLGKDYIFTNYPLVFKYNAIVHQYIEYIFDDTSEERPFKCLLPQFPVPESIYRSSGTNFVRPGQVQGSTSAGAAAPGSQGMKTRVVHATGSSRPPLEKDTLENYVTPAQKAAGKMPEERTYVPENAGLASETISADMLSRKMSQVYDKLDKHDNDLHVISDQMVILQENDTELKSMVRHLISEIVKQNDLLLKISGQRGYEGLRDATTYNKTLLLNAPEGGEKVLEYPQVSKTVRTVLRQKTVEPTPKAAIGIGSPSISYNFEEYQRAIALCNLSSLNSNQEKELLELSKKLLMGEKHGGAFVLGAASVRNPMTRSRLRAAIERGWSTLNPGSSS